MPCSFNGLLDKGFLFSEFRLELENSLVAACIGFTFLLTFAPQVCLPHPTLNKYSLDAFWLVWEFIVAQGEYH